MALSTLLDQLKRIVISPTVVVGKPTKPADAGSPLAAPIQISAGERDECSEPAEAPTGAADPLGRANRPGGPLVERSSSSKVPSNSTRLRPPIIELRGVSKSFDLGKGVKFVAFANLDLKILDHSEGEIVVLLGHSGCGKSTILNLVSGFIKPDSGKVLVQGEEVTGPNRRSATVPQSYTCFPWLTALQNVEFGLAVNQFPPNERRTIATGYMSKVGMGDRLGAYPRELSGGMQQRVAIARTLAVKRKIVLMDEPFGALDAQTREDMQQMLMQLWEAEKNTIIFVTHDIPEAVLLADRVLVFPSWGTKRLEEVSIKLPRPRQPDIVRDLEFMALCADLRRRLRKTAPGSPEMAQALEVER